MKFVVLLALLGLASCRTRHIGGNIAQDVAIEYSYMDARGDLVNVEMESDRMGLGLGARNRASSTPALGNIPVPPSRYIHRGHGGASSSPPMTPRYLRIPAPTVTRQKTVYKTHVIEIPVEVPVPKYVPVKATRVPEPETKTVTRYIEDEDDEDDDDDDEESSYKHDDDESGTSSSSTDRFRKSEILMPSYLQKKIENMYKSEEHY